MKVNYNWTNKTIIVSMDEVEAQRIAAFIFENLHVSPDDDADIPTRLEDGLREILS